VIRRFSAAFIGMPGDPVGRNILKLDGFTQAGPDLSIPARSKNGWSSRRRRDEHPRADGQLTARLEGADQEANLGRYAIVDLPSGKILPPQIH
jgi:hypothetical protein